VTIVLVWVVAKVEVLQKLTPVVSCTSVFIITFNTFQNSSSKYIIFK